MKIQLPEFVLADIYSNNLVIVEKSVVNKTEQDIKPAINKPVDVSEKKESKQPAAWFLGDNKKNITIVVTDKKHVFLDDESLNLLTGILNACQLTLADIALINFNQTPMNYDKISAHLKPINLFMFNVTTHELGLPFSIPHYQVQHYANCTFLSANDLHQMTDASQDAKLEKTKLWVCLKKIFGV